MVINSEPKETNLIKKGLYIVSTPIGNLQDITLRAIQTLKGSDLILCEDTRVSEILLNKYNIKKKLISNHKFNEKKNLLKVIGFLKKGFTISLISDAGTPTISDPGSILVKECINNKIDIFPVPGASSVTSALSVSGFSEKFFFYGFFPEQKKLLTNDLEILSKFPFTIVFFISSKKFNRIIQYLKKNFSGRRILICREMTKHFEEYTNVEIDNLKNLDTNLKGELTLVISENEPKKKIRRNLSESDKRLIRKMSLKLSTKDIISLMSRTYTASKKEIYNYCIKLKNEN